MEFQVGNPLRKPGVEDAMQKSKNVTLREKQKRWQKPSVEKALKYKVSPAWRNDNTAPRVPRRPCMHCIARTQPQAQPMEIVDFQQPCSCVS